MIKIIGILNVQNFKLKMTFLNKKNKPSNLKSFILHIAI